MDGNAVPIGVSKYERPAKWTVEGLVAVAVQEQYPLGIARSQQGHNDPERSPSDRRGGACWRRTEPVDCHRPIMRLDGDAPDVHQAEAVLLQGSPGSPVVSFGSHDGARSGIVQSHVGYESADHCGADTTTDRGGLADGVVGTYIARVRAVAHPRPRRSLPSGTTGRSRSAARPSLPCTWSSRCKGLRCGAGTSRLQRSQSSPARTNGPRVAAAASGPPSGDHRASCGGW